jgi:hypothetical protein
MDLNIGLQAWKRYHALLSRVAKRTGTTQDKATAVFAALSPNNDYLGNLRDAIRVLEAVRDGRLPEAVKVSTYHPNKFKAFDLAKGRPPLEVLKTPKVRNFYLNLLDPEDPQPVTIDGHMFNAWAGVRLRLDSAAQRYNAKHYFDVAADVHHIAVHQGLLANQVQGIIWFTWKRLHRIRHNDQLELLPADEMIVDIL